MPARAICAKPWDIYSVKGNSGCYLALQSVPSLDALSFAVTPLSTQPGVGIEPLAVLAGLLPPAWPQ
jgi:hypothetical protein